MNFNGTTVIGNQMRAGFQHDPLAISSDNLNFIDSSESSADRRQDLLDVIRKFGSHDISYIQSSRFLTAIAGETFPGCIDELKIPCEIEREDNFGLSRRLLLSSSLLIDSANHQNDYESERNN